MMWCVRCGWQRSSWLTIVHLVILFWVMGWNTFYQIINYRISQFVHVLKISKHQTESSSGGHGLTKWALHDTDYMVRSRVTTLHNWKLTAIIKLDGPEMGGWIKNSLIINFVLNRTSSMIIEVFQDYPVSSMTVYLDVNDHLFRLIIPFDRLQYT